MPTTYPGGGPRITVEALLKQPRLIARALTDLVRKRFVADRILMTGSAESVQGGAALYQKSESIYMTPDVEEVGVRAEYPRAAWSEEIFTATVRKYGLEFPVSDENKRRNQLDVVNRAIRKLSNSITKFVDGKAMSLILTDADVQTFGASDDWSDSLSTARDVIFDIAKAKNLVTALEEGYEPDTMVVNDAQELDLLANSDVRDVLPRESQVNSAITGAPVPLLGLSRVITTGQLTAGTVLVLDSGMAGTIADEMPGADENYTSFNPGAGKAVYTKIYRHEETDEAIVRGVRWPAMWLAEPKSIVKITSA